MTGRLSRAAHRRMTSVAISSSPQLAGTTEENPHCRHAWTNWTGVAGAAAATVSKPRMRIDGRLATQHQRLGAEHLWRGDECTR